MDKVEALREQAQERSAMTVDRLDSMLIDTFEMAKAAEKPQAMIGVCSALAKLHGLNAPTKKEVTGKAEGVMGISQILKDIDGMTRGLPSEDHGMTEGLPSDDHQGRTVRYIRPDDTEFYQ